QPEIKGAVRPGLLNVSSNLIGKLAELADSRPGRGRVPSPSPGVVEWEDVSVRTAQRTFVSRAAPAAPMTELLTVKAETVKLMQNVLAKASTLAPGISLETNFVTR